VAKYYNAIFLEMCQEIQDLEIKFGEEIHSMFDSELLEDLVGCVPDPGHARGRKKQYLHLMKLHWQMKTLVGLAMRGK